MTGKSSWTSNYFVKEVCSVRDKDTGEEQTTTFVVCSIRLSTGERCGKKFVHNNKSGTGNRVRHLRNEHGIIEGSQLSSDLVISYDIFLTVQ
jgi:hypothetical protein